METLKFILMLPLYFICPQLITEGMTKEEMDEMGIDFSGQGRD